MTRRCSDGSWRERCGVKASSPRSRFLVAGRDGREFAAVYRTVSTKAATGDSATSMRLGPEPLFTWEAIMGRAEVNDLVRILSLGVERANSQGYLVADTNRPNHDDLAQ